MIDELLLYEQFGELRIEFPKLRLQQEEAFWIISGTLKFSAEFSGKRIDDEYSVKLLIPEDYPENIPKAIETGNRIPDDFHHYRDDSLCLGAQLAVKRKFTERPTLIGFVEGCLIPYLYSYSYKNIYGQMPFGELSHGGWGILEYYQDLFELIEGKAVLDLIKILAENNYRGHRKCPCGSGKRLRSCHGSLLLELKELHTPAAFESDYRFILRALIEPSRVPR